VRYLDRDFALTGEPEAALLRVAAGVAGIREATAHQEGPLRLVVREVWRPVWTYVAAVVLFPVGLEVVCDCVLATLKDSAHPLAVRE